LPVAVVVAGGGVGSYTDMLVIITVLLYKMVRIGDTCGG